jgi:hypothetical protein
METIVSCLSPFEMPKPQVPYPFNKTNLRFSDQDYRSFEFSVYIRIDY